MFYKIVKDGKVIDVLDNIVFLKYQKKHDIMLLSSKSEAQAILSSDEQTIWHEESLHEIPKSGYDTVRVEVIDEHEYKQLKALNGKTPNEIIDYYTLFLIEEGVI